VSTLEQLLNAHIEQPLVGPPVVNVWRVEHGVGKTVDRWRQSLAG
jgi:K+-transporting ATPase ATPase C chain